MCHVAFLEQTGIWGQEVAISLRFCIMSLAVGTEKGQLEEIMEFITSVNLSLLKSQSDQKLRSVLKHLSSFQLFVSRLLVSVGFIKGCFPYNCKMAEALAEAH